jgi:hypothetical protein
MCCACVYVRARACVRGEVVIQKEGAGGKQEIACVSALGRACVHACVRARVRWCVRAYIQRVTLWASTSTVKVFLSGHARGKRVGEGGESESERDREQERERRCQIYDEYVDERDS